MPSGQYKHKSSQGFQKGHKNSEVTRKAISLRFKGKPKPDRRGDKHWNWKGGKSLKRGDRSRTVEYIQWRSRVFQRDNWTCQTCGLRSGEGKAVKLEAHHIKAWAKYPEFRYEVDNGVTLCRECHKLTF